MSLLSVRMGVLAALVTILYMPLRAQADSYLQAIWDNATLTGGGPVFPNWQMVHMGSFDVQLYDGGSPEYITALTVVNFGTALDGDIGAVYFRAWCNNTDSGILTMNYAGEYSFTDQVTETHPAWTWTDIVFPDLSSCDDPGGGAIFTLDIFADIGPCPVEGRTIKLGLPVNWTNTWTAYGGSLYDNWGTTLPWGALASQIPFDLLYIFKKADRDLAPPADTITYTIYYGRPGSAAELNSIQIFDTLPAYTHYVGGSASPFADSEWAPNPGPPQRLRWTIPGPIPTAGGPTSEIVFQATIDWGNGELIDPGSGDFPAPEGERLWNSAVAYFDGAECEVATAPPVITVVRRFLFWMLGDNDLLFASSISQEPDVMEYGIYVKNLSDKKTWWDVSIWDTVPDELDVWSVNCGLDDPFLGWTMTPTPSALGSPKRSVVDDKTILDWRLDIPPSYTVTLRWKAQVNPSAPAGSHAINQVSLLAFGRTGIQDGTGSSVNVKRFTHLAPIALWTTFISYVGFSAEEDDPGPGMMIDFFPLNKRTQFQLFGIHYDGTRLFSTQGGVSDSIGCSIGDCKTGFIGNDGCVMGSGPIPGGGIAGCKFERIPAVYDPVWTAPVVPFNLIYKVISNSPLVWQLLTQINDCNQDRHTYAPSTTMTYRGWMHYTWPGDYTAGSSLTFINTGMDVYLNFQPDLATSVHLFKYDYGDYVWQYVRTFELGPQAATGYLMRGPDTFPATSPDFVPWRMISSDTALLVDVGSYEYHTAGCCCCSGADNHGTFEPTRETGFTVSPVDESGNPKPATFYGLTNDLGCGAGESVAVVGNMGVAAATYDVYLYTPRNTIGDPMIPPLLRNSEGVWGWIGTFNVPPGETDPGNPRVHKPSPFRTGGTALHQIRLRSGGPIQVNTGSDTFAGWGGGGVIHSTSGKTMGKEFWLPTVRGRMPGGGKGCEYQTHNVLIFTPKANTFVTGRAEDDNGYFAQYTTYGPDQCVNFVRLTRPDDDSKRNWIFTSEGSDAIALYNQCTQTEKGFTAPFLETGLHYEIVNPPVVFLGQKFWITVVVLGGGNITKDDYCGTSSFSSTDPLAILEDVPMDLYDYIWGADPPSNCDFYSPYNDNGVRVFINVTMNTVGDQTIVVSDIDDGSIVGLGTVMVVAADVKLTKEPQFAVRASGEELEFRICWSNFSSASVEEFTVTDAIPNGTTYSPDAEIEHFCGWTGGDYVTGSSVAFSTAGSAATDFEEMEDGGAGVENVTWLRWIIPIVGVRTTGCVCFRVTVD